MRIWFDTEFVEDGHTIDLISIGLVREDGAEYYAELQECDIERSVPWVRENVWPHLQGGTALKPRAEIASEIIAFAGLKPEFWAYYASYDWVALCQLFGRMIDLPQDWPRFVMDVKMLHVLRGRPGLPEQPAPHHHALADAKWDRELWGLLT